MGVVSCMTKRRRGPDELIDAVLTGGWSVPLDLFDAADRRSRSQRRAARLRRTASLIDGLAAVASTASPCADGRVAIDPDVLRHYARGLRRRRNPPEVRAAAKELGGLLAAAERRGPEALVPADLLAARVAALEALRGPRPRLA